MKNITKILLTIYLFVSVNICFGQEVLSLSKWRFGTALSGGYSFANKDLTNDLNNYASCIWEIDLYYNRIQTSFYSQANWSQKNNLFDFGLRAGYNIVDGNVVQFTPLIGLGVMSFSHDSNLKNILTPSVGANFDFKLWTNKKSKRNDIWMIRLRYNCSMPSVNDNVVGIHSISIGIAVKGTLF